MSNAVEGSLVCASSNDKAIDWKASKITSEKYAMESRDGPQFGLKAKTGKEITKFQYSLLTDMEYTELLRDGPDPLNPDDPSATGRMFVQALKTYDIAVTEVKCGKKEIDKDTGVKPANKWNIGMRIQRMSRLAADERDF